MSLKFPTVKRKDQRVPCLANDLPSFCCNDVADKDDIGRGSFGSVFVAKFPGLSFPGLNFPGLSFPRLIFPGLSFPGLSFPGLRS